MTTFRELRDKFDADVAELQARCPHIASDWLDFEWAPGHYGDKVRVCLSCDKRLESRPGDSPKSVTSHYEGRDDGIYVVWDEDFPGDTPGSRKLRPEEVTDAVKATLWGGDFPGDTSGSHEPRPDEITDAVKTIMEKKWKWRGSK